MNNGERAALPAFFIAFAWWIAAGLLFWLLFWATSSLDQRSLMRSVNTAFEASHDARRVSAPLPSWGPDGSAGLAGRRFALKNKKEVAVVFALNGAGAAASFIAVYSDGKGIVAVLPLYERAKVSAERLPVGLFETYLHRIAVSEMRCSAKKAEGK